MCGEHYQAVCGKCVGIFSKIFSAPQFTIELFFVVMIWYVCHRFKKFIQLLLAHGLIFAVYVHASRLHFW